MNPLRVALRGTYRVGTVIYTPPHDRWWLVKWDTGETTWVPKRDVEALDDG